MATRGVLPGSFDPPTVAHVALAEAARERYGLERVDLAISRVPLAKEHVEHPLVEHRHQVLVRVARRVPWLGAAVTDRRLLADIATGYDVLVVGADKWHQLVDPAFYGDDATARDAALARLPFLAVAPRPPWETPELGELRAAGVDGEVLDPVPQLTDVSSSRARAGVRDLLVAEARAFDDATGAWSDPSRYRRWLAEEAEGVRGAT